MFLAVLDTNVLVSALLKPTSVPGEVLCLSLKGILCPVANEAIFAEYVEVLYRDKFQFDPDVLRVFLAGFRSRLLFLEETKTEEPFVDEDDRVFFEVALSACKLGQAFLVTGNSKHFPDKGFVVTPAQLLEKLNYQDFLGS
ncbi:PIN domain-containing protein [Mobiluncus mulieris]|uniref:PIN domain-containing protein n=1 Tax=Mobiluncus mulieris TaxID=2052 RepID=UPI002430D9CF|nr:PIN domain-containing protein [Mobiluncus mulieris]